MSRQPIACQLNKLVFKHLNGMSVNYTITESKETAGKTYSQECFIALLFVLYTQYPADIIINPEHICRNNNVAFHRNSNKYVHTRRSMFIFLTHVYTFA
jgi:hypothetical protein